MDENQNNKQNGNLEDIMIDGGGGQKQLKKILMIIALVIVVLIVAIAVTKLVIGDDEQKQTQQQEAPVQAPQASQEAQPLFEEVPIDEQNQQADEELDNMINELRNQQDNTSKQTAGKPAKPKEPAQPEPKQQETKPEPKQPEQSQQAQQSEEEHDPYDVKEGYWYVQVGSFERLSPNEAFLKEIEEKGYKYYYYRTEVNGKQYTKVVIGGYEDRDEAKAHRKRIRDEINEGAFLLRVQNAQ